MVLEYLFARGKEEVDGWTVALIGGRERGNGDLEMELELGNGGGREKGDVCFGLGDRVVFGVWYRGGGGCL